MNANVVVLRDARTRLDEAFWQGASDRQTGHNTDLEPMTSQERAEYARGYIAAKPAEF